MERDTGGQAFPKTGSFHDSGNACYDSVDSDGMTLRDYLAAKAMQGDLASGGAPKHLDSIASRSYAIADAMLRARGQ